jgi:2-oxoglutarate dehydrogenase E2 component (dihydrolipoamide succinyltransferase)
MKTILSQLPLLFVLAGCAAAAPQDQAQPEQQAQAEQQAPAEPPAPPQPEQPAAQPAPPPAAAAASTATGCEAVQPWNRASRALGHPVVPGTGFSGRPTYSIKRVSYSEILGDRELTEGVSLVDQSGRAPAPGALFNIVWTAEPDSTDSNGRCTTRYSAPTFLDVR